MPMSTAHPQPPEVREDPISPGRGRDRYDPRVVSSTWRAIAWLHRHRLHNVVFFLLSPPLWILYAIFLFILNRLEVHGREHLPRGRKGWFLLSNHASFTDGQALQVVLYPRPFWYPSKAEFYASPLRAIAYYFMTAGKSFPVRRGERDAQAIGFMQDLLRNGESVLLFPEGTRSPDGRLGPGKIGVGRIIHETRPVVVPAYLHGFWDLWPKHRPLPRIGHRLSIRFGPPVALDDLYDREPSREVWQECVDRVMAAIAALKEEEERLSR